MLKPTLYSLTILLPLAVLSFQEASAKTKTSTGVRFPEEGGQLPRAEMPEGGVDRDLDEETGEPKTAKKEEHEAPRVEIEAPDCERNPNSANCPGEVARGEEWRKKLTFSYDGYLKVIAESIQTPGVEVPFVGKNNGFRIGNARLGFLAMYDNNLRAYISVDASVANNEDINDVNSQLAVGPRDMYIAYDLTRHASIRIGRFKAPYDVSTLQDEGGRIFIDLPVESRGVDPTQGYELIGLRQDRQMGLMLHRERLGLTKDGFDLGYALALTNGRTENAAINDNNQLAGYARFSIYWGQWLTLNVAGFSDTRTTGTQPNLFDEEWKGLEGSIVLRLLDLRLEGQYLINRQDFPTSGAPHVNWQGFHAQGSYRFKWGWLEGLEPAYRFSYYDPSQRSPEGLAVREHAFGASYYLVALPLRVTVNYTITGQEPGRKISNNRLAGLVQFNF